MKKIMFQCLCNTLLFTLFGLAFLFPFSSITQTENGFSGTITIFPILLFGYLIIYPTIYYVFKTLFKWDKKDNTELAYSDEREKTIVAEATKTVYKILIGGLFSSIAILGGVRFFSLFSHENINIYFISVLLLTILLILSSVSYCIKWCVEYYK